MYTDLKALYPEPRRPPDREIELHLTGNMERYTWSIDGKTYAQEPIILHGMWMQLEYPSCSGTRGRRAVERRRA